MIRYFRKNTSKIPVDNGSSLNIPITKIINALANITITKTSVLVVNRIPVIRYFRDTRYIFISKKH
jgi:hypothetical protein